jgi:hypothetical protein
MTVAWMISVLSVATCDLGAGILRLLIDSDQSTLGLLSGVLFFAALVIGFISLGLLPIVLRSRQVPPPPGLVAFGVVAALFPWIALVARLVIG